MSVPKLLVVTAVPFSLARLESSFNPYASNNTTASFKDSNTNHSNLKRIVVNSKQNGTNDMDNSWKKHNRILKNRISSQVSREKAKIKKDLLEKQLLELQMEQMKIRLLNNELELRQSKLEEENAILKERMLVGALNHEEEVGSFHPHSFGRIYQQFTDSKFPQYIHVENSTHCKERQQTNRNSYCLPEVAVESPEEKSLCLENDFSDDFNLIENMIFGQGFDFYDPYSVNLMKNQFSDHETKETFHSEEKSIPCNVPEWTFEDLYDDIENTSLCSN